MDEQKELLSNYEKAQEHALRIRSSGDDSAAQTYATLAIADEVSQLRSRIDKAIEQQLAVLTELQVGFLKMMNDRMANLALATNSLTEVIDKLANRIESVINRIDSTTEAKR